MTHDDAAETIGIDALKAALDAGAPTLLLDVRTLAEFSLGHIPGATHVPVASLDAFEVPPDADVIVYCQTGPRAEAAATRLRGRAARIRVLRPGFAAWPSQSDTPAHRYLRQTALPEVGAAGQAKLQRARVAVVGAGGLGSPALLYLAGAGVGGLTLIDGDVVDETNLHRQILHTTERLGAPKVESGVATLRALNPEVKLRAVPQRLTEGNAEALLAGADVIVDGSDNLSTRYTLARASVKLRVPVAHASVHRFLGQLTLFIPEGSTLGPPGPCYACLFPTPPGPEDAPNCADAGVLGPVPGVLGAMQATMVLELLLGLGHPLLGRMLHLDLARMVFRTFETPRDPGCAVCGRPAISLPRAP